MLIGRNVPLQRKQKHVLRINVESAAVPHHHSNDYLGAQDGAVRYEPSRAFRQR